MAENASNPPLIDRDDDDDDNLFVSALSVSVLVALTFSRKDV